MYIIEIVADFLTIWLRSGGFLSEVFGFVPVNEEVTKSGKIVDIIAIDNKKRVIFMFVLMGGLVSVMMLSR